MSGSSAADRGAERVQSGPPVAVRMRLQFPWRLALLYVRVRLVGWAVLGVVALAGTAYGAIVWEQQAPSRMLNFTLVALLPLLAAALVAGTLTTPWAEVEQTTPAPLARWRLAQAGGLALLAAALLALVCAQWPLEMTGWIVLRNVAGAAGLALATAALLGGRLAWLGLALGGALLMGADIDTALRWVWPTTSWREQAAMLLPPVALLVGLLLVALRPLPLRGVQRDDA